MQNIICGVFAVQNLRWKRIKNRGKNLQNGILCLYIYIMNWEEQIRKKINQLKAGASGLGSIAERATGKRENKFGAFFMLVGEPI